MAEVGGKKDFLLSMKAQAKGDASTAGSSSDAVAPHTFSSQDSCMDFADGADDIDDIIGDAIPSSSCSAASSSDAVSSDDEPLQKKPCQRAQQAKGKAKAKGRPVQRIPAAQRKATGKHKHSSM